MQIVQAGLSVIVAGVLTTLFFIVLGVFLPIWTMIAIDGMQEVQDAPAHGGAILFLTLPIAGMISIPAFMLLSSWLYEKFKSNTSEDPGQAETHN